MMIVFEFNLNIKLLRIVFVARNRQKINEKMPLYNGLRHIKVLSFLQMLKRVKKIRI